MFKKHTICDLFLIYVSLTFGHLTDKCQIMSHCMVHPEGMADASWSQMGIWAHVYL